MGNFDPAALNKWGKGESTKESKQKSQSLNLPEPPCSGGNARCKRERTNFTTLLVLNKTKLESHYLGKISISMRELHHPRIIHDETQGRGEIMAGAPITKARWEIVPIMPTPCKF